MTEETETTMPKKRAAAPAAPKTPRGKKKDFSEAIAASAEIDAANGNGAAGPTIRQPVILRRYREKLPVQIDDNAVAVKAQELAKIIHEKDQVLEDRAEAARSFREKIAFFKQRETELATSIDLHTEATEIAVCDRLIVETSTVEVVRLDTNVVVTTRAATPEELQKHLFAKEEWSEGANPRPPANLPVAPDPPDEDEGDGFELEGDDA